MKPLLIGEAPSKNQDPPLPLEGRIGRRLAGCAGLSYDAYLTAFDRVNLLQVRQDTAEKGFTFDLAAAKDEVKRLRRDGLLRERTIILLGHRVADAFNINSLRYFHGVPTGQGGMLWLMPHPSGVNRWWNDAENQAAAERFLRGVVRRGAHV